MIKHTAFIFIALLIWNSAQSQVLDAYVHTAEIGVGAGVGHYFGDLNPDAGLRSPKIAYGAFYKKQFSPYIGIRISGEYSFLGYSDIYSSNIVQQRRNLSFNTDLWEIALSGDFNFFRFQPEFEEFRFTPYVGLGLSVFSYDPYAYLNGEKYQLRNLGTEGQGSALYPNLTPYSSTAIGIPFTLGVKKALSVRTNIFAEVIYRFTNTDYLDDVSGLYAPDAFSPLPDGSASPAYLLQDRSYETGIPIASKGRQRGNSLASDAFATFKVGISFNFKRYRCPSY